MNIVDIINKKRKNISLTKEEIEYVITNYVSENITDYQMSALLMAITINGMSDEETIYLTDAMLNSGDKIDLSSISGIKLDKHSTGGVGDKTTLILAPIVAATGLNMAKMSGRGLGFTGGTIDKLEAIPGLKTSMPLNEFKKQVNDIHVAIASGSKNLVPADKKMYALRDVTATVESIPLIASSIMSKKLASGADILVIDVKVGNGALMKTEEDAENLSNLMIKIGKNYNKKVVCILTNMYEPLGEAIGNSLEVEESINVLQGKGPKDITSLVIYLAIQMVKLGKNISLDEATKEVRNVLVTGKALNKFYELIKYQQGNINDMVISNKVVSIKANKSGFITKINTEGIGELSRKLGAGRYEKDDVIDPSVGIKILKKIGDFVISDEELVKVYLGEKDININEILDCFEIDEHYHKPSPLIIGTIE